MAKVKETTTAMKLLIDYVVVHCTMGDVARAGEWLADRRMRKLFAAKCAQNLLGQTPYCDWSAENWMVFHQDCARGLGRR